MRARWWVLLGAAVGLGACSGAKLAAAYGQAAAEVDQARVDGWHVGAADLFPRALGGVR